MDEKALDENWAHVLPDILIYPPNNIMGAGAFLNATQKKKNVSIKKRSNYPRKLTTFKIYMTRIASYSSQNSFGKLSMYEDSFEQFELIFATKSFILQCFNSVSFQIGLQLRLPGGVHLMSKSERHDNFQKLFKVLYFFIQS